MVAVAPSQVGVIVKLASSVISTVKVTALVCGHDVPIVVYSTVYVAPDVPFVTVPSAGSIIAPSVGTGLNVKVPPVSPVTFAVAPSQVGVIVKPALSIGSTFNTKVVLDGHTPAVV